MRDEVIVILVCLGLAVVCAVFCYCCLVVASDGDRRTENAEKEMKKNQENNIDGGSTD